MKHTSSTENNIPIPNITVVREAPKQLVQKDLENINQVTELSNQEDIPEQKDDRPNIAQKISYWNGLYAFVILGVCIACTCTITMIPRHNIFEHPEFWWESIFLSTLFFGLFRTALPLAWEAYLIFGAEFISLKLHSLLYFTAYYLGWNIPYLCIYIVWTGYTAVSYTHLTLPTNREV